ncbi:unnamed protein product, partial [Oppiella nova]
DLFLEFYRTLTNQTATKLKVFSNFNIAYNKNILFKPTLITESLEDLMDNKALMIAGRAAIPYLKAYKDPYFKDIATTIVTRLGYECGLIAHTQAIQHMATGVMVKGWNHLQHNVTQFDDTVYLAKPEHMCWLALIWLHIMYTFITHRMCDSRISFSDLFLEFYRTLTNQTATKLKAFSSVLRNSYFKFKPTLMADSLEDLIDNKALMIAGRTAIPYLEAYKDPYFKDIAKTIVTRVTTYENRIGINTKKNNSF